MTRKLRPTRIYREEVIDLSPGGNRNSTRQTFDKWQYQSWIDATRVKPDCQFEHRFFIGTIHWVRGEDAADDTA